MNTGNAFGFLGLGIGMWLLPFIAPAWFSQVAIDGSSTRALWVQAMGLLQCALGAGYLARQGYFMLQGGVQELVDRMGPQRGAVATGDWTTGGWPENVVTVDFTRTATAEGSVAASQSAVTPIAAYGRRAAPALARMLEKAWVTEERISEFITRAGRRHLALHAGGLAAYLRRVSSRRDRGDSLNAIYELFQKDFDRQQSLRDAA